MPHQNLNFFRRVTNFSQNWKVFARDQILVKQYKRWAFKNLNKKVLKILLSKRVPRKGNEQMCVFIVTLQCFLYRKFASCSIYNFPLK